MASIQAKIHNGRKYWCIVECKRINGKPKTTVIEYLGTADSLLARLSKKQGIKKIKSFSHGCVVALLALAKKLDVVSIINKHTSSKREYWATKVKNVDGRLHIEQITKLFHNLRIDLDFVL